MARPLLALAALLIPCAVSCRSVPVASSTKDIAASEQAGLSTQQAIYYINGTEIFRALCPGTLQAGNGNARAACNVIAAQASVVGFRQTIQSLYTQTYGAFGAAESQELEKLISILGNPTQTTTVSPGGLGVRFMALMAAAVLAAPDGPQGGNSGGNPLPNPNPQQAGLLAGPITATVFQANSPGEITIDGLNRPTLSKIRVALSAGCPFQTVGVTAGQGFGGGGPQPLTDANSGAGGVSTMWQANGTVQPLRLFLTFTGQPGSCQVNVFDGVQSPGDQGQGGSGGPAYVLSIYSTQGLFGAFSPNKTHTFAFFAQIDPATRQISDYVPMSWLPVLTDPNTGAVLPDGAQNLQIGPIQTLNGQPRLGFDFSMTTTVAFISRAPIANGVFVISADFFRQAKAWRDTLDANARNVLAGQQLAGRFLYVADDRDNYPNDCTNPQPDALNCFHAFSALANACLHTGIASGLSATVKVMGLFQQLGLIRQQPTTQFGDPGTLLNTAMAYEQSQGGFGQP